MVNQKYVAGLTTGLSQFDYLHADQENPTNYTKYNLNQNLDGSYSFRSIMNMKYISASNAGYSPLIADKETIGTNGFESFFIEPIDSQLNNVFDWEIYASNGFFGQIFDHTFGDNGGGHFILANGLNRGDFSRITSQNLEKTADNGVCMSFYYYFNGGSNNRILNHKL